jgi:hypothetical protein
MIGEEILVKIDSTLDQLIQNAESIRTVDLKDLSEMELEAFQKTQESLISHLLHMDQLLQTKRSSLKVPHHQSASKKIQEKRLKFEGLESTIHKRISESGFGKVPFSLKRRSKRFL